MTGRPYGDAFRERTRLYARYTALVGMQEEVLDENDLDRFSELAEEKDTLQNELDASPVPTLPPLAHLEPDVARLVEEAAARLREAIAAEGRIGQRLHELRDETAQEIRNMDARESGVRSYVMRSQPESRPPSARIDVRL